MAAVVLSRVADALDAHVARTPAVHEAFVAAGAQSYSFADIARGYRAGDEFAVSYIANGVDLLGVDGFIASLS